MNAALLGSEADAGASAHELARINESLQARERLLTASAQASRLLLEAPDVRAAIPAVLGLIGEAARVDRVNLMLAYAGGNGERLLSVVSEWTPAHGTVSPPPTPVCTCEESSCVSVFAELRAGRSVASATARAPWAVRARLSKASVPRPRRSCRFSSAESSLAWSGSTTHASIAPSTPRSSRRSRPGRCDRSGAAPRAAGR